MIFVVEDDPNIRELVTYTLQSTGFDACGFENGSEFLKALSDGEKPELVLLDIMLPGEDGISILGKLRKKSATRDLPIIMMTAKGTEYDKVLGLDSGADDYITKPFSPLELVARVKTQLRRYTRYNTADPREQERNEHDFRGLFICQDSHQCTLNGEDLTLTPIEFNILWYLCEHRGKVVSSEELFEAVWKEKYMDGNNTVMAHIARLREKMKEPSRKPKFIKTVWGVGYTIE